MFRALLHAIFNFIARIVRRTLILIIWALLFVVLLVVTQDFQVFPALVPSIFEKSVRDESTLPEGVKSVFLTTADDKKIEVWVLRPPAGGPEAPHRAALILHGNGGPVDAFFSYQKWLQSLGITSYSAEYRGIGKSTGWPSEKGIYLDAEAAFSYLLGQEEMKAEDVMVLGISIGTAPAAFLAKRHPVGTLVLLSPFVSIPAVVEDSPVLKYFRPFLWYQFPVQEFLRDISSCVVMAHGKRDTVIPFSHMQRLKRDYTGRGPLHTIVSGEADHNDLFHRVREELSEKVLLCLNQGVLQAGTAEESTFP